MKKAFLFGRPFSWGEELNCRSRHLSETLHLHVQSLSALLGEHVPVLVLNHTVEVKARDAFSNSRLPNTQCDISFDSLPEISFQCGQPNQFVHFLFVLLNDIENHQVVLIHEVGAVLNCESHWTSVSNVRKIARGRDETEVFKGADMYNLFTPRSSSDNMGSNRVAEHPFDICAFA